MKNFIPFFIYGASPSRSVIRLMANKPQQLWLTVMVVVVVVVVGVVVLVVVLGGGGMKGCPPSSGPPAENSPGPAGMSGLAPSGELSTSGALSSPGGVGPAVTPESTSGALGEGSTKPGSGLPT